MSARRKTSNKWHTVRLLDPLLTEKIESTAHERGWSISEVYREAIKDFFDKECLREEFVNYKDMTEASFNEVSKQITHLRNDIQVMMAFFDLFTKSYYLHTPAVLSDATDTDIAIVNAKQRYEKLIKQLPEAIQGQEGIFQALITEKEFGN